MVQVRNDCLNLISAILDDHRPSHLVISEYLDTHSSEINDADKSFVKRLVQGVAERRITLDAVINKVSDTKTAKMKPVIRNILRMGTYQILYMNVPDSAAVNESVKLTQKRNISNLRGFVNAVLRSISRQKESIADFSDEKNSMLRLCAEFSTPEWLVKYLVNEYGYDTARTIFEYYLKENETSIRCNISKIDPQDMEKRLIARGYTVSRNNIADKSRSGSDNFAFCKTFLLSDYSSLADIPEFREGLFTVQDLSSVMSGDAVAVKPGDRILDLCAAPGGKSLNLADRLLFEEKRFFESGVPTSNAHEGCVISCDISARKTALIEENVNRCGFKNIITKVNDATIFNAEFENAFEIVVADVPCSGIGIIGKKPDIKYNMTPEKQKELVVLQRQILDNAVRYVKQGGQFVFSTCTVNKEENQLNVDYIKQKGFKCITSKQLLPGVEGTDGFFYAILIKQ